MMSFLLMMILMNLMFILVNSKNPMKASFLILISTSMMFLVLKLESGSSWFPLIFFILFTGGILMMFMILSSILPNEKTMKMKFSKTTLFLTTFFTLFLMKYPHKGSNFNFIKSTISSNWTFTFMVVMILIYFFNSISLNSNEEMSMRSFICR